MKFNLKAAFGALLVTALVGGSLVYLQAKKTPEVKPRRSVDVEVISKQLDCGHISTAVEKLICSEQELKQLDIELGVAFHNDTLWQLHTAPFPKKGEELQDQCVKYQPEKCLERLKTAQRLWEKNSRDVCTTTECLANAYRSRIAEINGQSEPLPNFRLSTNRRPELCGAMLEVLNRTPRERLGACTEHDFTGTPFTAMTNDTSQKLKIGYAQHLFSSRRYETRQFDQYWQEDIEPQYQVGLKKLFSREIDIDNDGESELLLQHSEADSKCMALSGSDVTERKKMLVDNNKNWKLLSDSEKYGSAMKTGWLNVVYLLKDGEYNPVRYGQPLEFNNNYVVLEQGGMLNIDEKDSKERIVLYTVPNKQEENYGWEGSETCSYWYNY